MIISPSLDNKLKGIKNGRRIIAEDEKRLSAALPGRVPKWYLDFVSKYPIIGTLWTLGEGDDISSLGVELKWLSPDTVVEEMTIMEPGKTAFGQGFLVFGGCELGSGDPYFIDLNGESTDSPVVRIYHDSCNNGKFSKEGVAIVCESLSQFLGKARCP
jgi:hypothetical protein